MTKSIVSLLIVFCTTMLYGQGPTVDTIDKGHKFNYKALIIPTVLIGYGIVGLESHTLKLVNSGTKSELNEHIDEKLSVDDFSQYSPMVAVYALNASGVKGKHNFRDRTTILCTAYLLMGTTVAAVKLTGNVERPDKTSFNSFPSGHTATAFMGAEFLYQEYKDVSVWYGVAGYAVAAGTGFFRMYNDRHWLTDVAAGAGIGMLSTKIAYWIHPFVQRTIFGNGNQQTGMIMPFYTDGKYGVGIAMTF